MPAAVIDDDATEVIDPNETTLVDPNAALEEDDGSTPDTPAQEAARAEALRKVAAETPADEVLDPDDTPAPGVKPGTKPSMIPASRFNEVNERMKALDDELKALKAASTTPPAPAVAAPPAEAAFDVKKAMKDKLSALASGDDDKALELEEKIQAHTLTEARRLAREDMEAANAEMSQAQQMRELKAAGADIKIAYPQLDNANEETANPDAILFVIAKRDALVSTGMLAHNALREAAAQAAKLFGFEGEKPPATTVNKAEERAAEARARNAAALASQAPALGGNGERSTKPARVDIRNLSDAQLKALPADELAKLDGSA